MLEVRHISKAYAGEFAALPVLSDVSLCLARGECCALTGASGSGKTTLMNLIGLLDRPDRGEIRIDGVATAAMAEPVLAQLRNRLIGFVFESFHLLPQLAAIDNVALPLLYRGMGVARRQAAAREALRLVGLADRATHRPDQLSGGQRHRVAIARALVGEPRLLLADDIMTLFLHINATLGVTVVIVTHDPTLAARCPRRIIMRDGRIEDGNRSELRAIESAS